MFTFSWIELYILWISIYCRVRAHSYPITHHLRHESPKTNKPITNQIDFVGCTSKCRLFCSIKVTKFKIHSWKIINQRSYCKTHYVIQVSNPRWPPCEGYDMSWVHGGGGDSTSIALYLVLAPLLRRTSCGTSWGEGARHSLTQVCTTSVTIQPNTAVYNNWKYIQRNNNLYTLKITHRL